MTFNLTGPYKVLLLKSERCKTPSKPYDKNPSTYFTSEIYTAKNRTLLRGNLTVVRVDPQLWLSSKGFILAGDKYEAIYVARAVGCNGVLMRIFKIGLNVQHLKGCVPKGMYLYKDVDFNAIQQTWTKTLKYGSYLWRLQQRKEVHSTMKAHCLSHPSTRTQQCCYLAAEIDESEVPMHAFDHYTKGPYKTTVFKSEKCKTPTKPYDKNPAYLYYCEAYKSGEKMLLRANFTVIRVDPLMKINIRAYIKEGDGWKIMYINKSGGCQGFVMEAMKYIFGVQKSGCIPKGTYTYNHLDFNEIQHNWLKTFMYGRFLWTVQMLTSAGTNVCWQFETDITPKLE
ncbi:uncharacterized protein LOC128679503 [Plodia interpunctella]|uniref:uncharacterized protein LOC128679503 n=1 Tax=Plodia interpunctella TaxID=58824 RepID=UPI002368C02C|nr:uncharacterized protein LOC128679503 [Plodia interpunctella]